jgi:thiamine-phosphate pyrophosphorylase|tara:strand:- start:193 stop:765 length:573 start_codon:yes stop_codon:yes gene_type:complete
MFTKKNKYFLLIESIKDIDLKNIKIRNKFLIIYRNNKNIDNLDDLFIFRRKCKLKGVKFYVANNISLAVDLNSDGIYLSSFNKGLRILNYKKKKFEIIGSAHNFKEITLKKKQGCSFILLSKLFIVDYNKSAPHLGIIKFNNYSRYSKKLIPLGGIKQENLNNLKNAFCEGFALLSEIKKKPANIINRLF